MLVNNGNVNSSYINTLIKIKFTTKCKTNITLLEFNNIMQQRITKTLPIFFKKIFSIYITIYY